MCFKIIFCYNPIENNLTFTFYHENDNNTYTYIECEMNSILVHNDVQNKWPKLVLFINHAQSISRKSVFLYTHKKKAQSSFNQKKNF